MSCPGSDVCLCDCHNGYGRACSMTGGCGLQTTPAPSTSSTTGRRAKRIDIPALEADIHSLTHPGGYLRRLQQLIPEPGTTGTGETTRHTKVIGSPAPWNDEAAGLLFEVHASARRHETRLRHELGWPPVRRGGTDTHTRDALGMLPRLIDAVLSHDGADRGVAEKVALDIERWPRRAREVLDDDPKADERPHTRAPGRLTCPYCERGLILKHGWQYATTDDERSLWCLRCPSTFDDEHPRGRDLSWPASAWIAVLSQAGEGA